VPAADPIADLLAASERSAPPRGQEIREFGFRQLPDVSRVFVRTAGAPRFSIEEADGVLRLRFDRARVLRRNDERPLDTSFFPSAVSRITPRREGATYVLEMTLRARVPYQQRVEGDLLSVDFELPAAER
jgi:hypothetical protein